MKKAITKCINNVHKKVHAVRHKTNCHAHKKYTYTNEELILFKGSKIKMIEKKFPLFNFEQNVKFESSNIWVDESCTYQLLFVFKNK